MSVFGSLRILSPDERVGVAGLTVSLVGMITGIVTLLFLEQTTSAWGLVVASLIVGWVSFLYCVGGITVTEYLLLNSPARNVQ